MERFLIKFGLVSGLGRFEFDLVKILDYWLILCGLLLESSMAETQEVSGSRLWFDFHAETLRGVPRCIVLSLFGFTAIDPRVRLACDGSNESKTVTLWVRSNVVMAYV